MGAGLGPCAAEDSSRFRLTFDRAKTSLNLPFSGPCWKPSAPERYKRSTLPPCSTFSKARCSCGFSGVGARRDGDHLWSLPQLNPAQAERVRVSNQLPKFSAKLFRRCVAAEVPVTLENPGNNCFCPAFLCASCIQRVLSPSTSALLNPAGESELSFANNLWVKSVGRPQEVDPGVAWERPEVQS